jgi:NTP pyrophosphatase (non-canonical NTP hydrolase)
MKEKDSLKEIQKKADNWIKNHGGYWPPLAMLSAVVEEVGELAREINHLEGFKPKKSTEKQTNLGEELADILFSIICIANYYKIDLNERLNQILKKYSKRDINRFI